MIRKSLLLSGSFILPVCAAAQTPEHHDEHDDTIDEIVVTAVPLGREADDLTQPAAVVDEAALLLRAAASIGETLTNEVGVSSTYFGPVSGRPVIRGQSGPRVSVLEGGVGTLDVADLSPDHAVPVEPLFADRVEIIRGPATLLYGSSAAGGVVNVIDSRIPRQQNDVPFAGGAELRGDTATGEQAAAVRLDGDAGNVSWHLNAFDRESDDIDIDGFATADPAERPDDEPEGTVKNTFGESSGYSAGATLFLDRGSFGASVSRYENRYGLPKAEEEEEPAPGEPPEPELFDGPFIDLEQTRVDLRGEYDFDGFIETAKLRVGINDYEHNEIEPSGEVGTTFLNEAWESRLELVHAPVAGWRGAAGIQVIDRDFNASGEEAYVAPTQTSSVGVFLFEERETTFGRVEVGARIETLEHEPESVLADYDETAVSLAFGADWNLTDTVDLRLNLSRSERNPDAAELYSDGAHLATGLFEIGLVAAGGDPDTEVSTNVDVGYHLHSDRVDLTVNLFYNDIADYVFLEQTGVIEDGLPEALFVQRDAEFYGAEFELNLQGRDSASPWSGRVFGDYVRGKADSQDLPLIQPPRLGAAVRYTETNWSAGGEAIFHAEQDQVSSFQTDAFTMVNADVIWHLDGERVHWDLFLKASNLLDEDARRSTSFLAARVPLPGRNLQAGVRLRFD